MKLYNRWFAKHASTGMLCGGSYVGSRQLDRIINNLRHSHDLYYGINPSLQFDGIKATDETIPKIFAILIDIDPKDKTHALGHSLDHVFAHCLSISLQTLLGYIPSHRLVYSGRGYQSLLAVEPFDVGSGGHAWRNTVRSFLLSLRSIFSQTEVSQYASIDVATSDLSRVCRIPYTTNFKTGQKAILIHDFDSNLCPSVQAPWLVSRFLEPAIPEFHLKNKSDWWKHFPSFSVAARRFLTEGVDNGTRNHHAYATARCLAACGLPRDLVLDIVSAGNKLSVPPLEWDEVQHVVQSAFRH